MSDETENKEEQSDKIEETEVDESSKTDGKGMTDEEINAKAQEMMNKINEAFKCKGGIGFLPLLALLFIALKLTHVIAWSWWWVLAPLYPMAIGIGLVFILAVLLSIVVIATSKKK